MCRNFKQARSQICNHRHHIVGLFLNGPMHFYLGPITRNLVRQVLKSTIYIISPSKINVCEMAETSVSYFALLLKELRKNVF